MYEVWFIDCCGHSYLEAWFDCEQDAEAYVSESNESLSLGERYSIRFGWD